LLTAGEAKNADNAVVLARLFNEASGQKSPSKKHGLFISRPYDLELPKITVATSTHQYYLQPQPP
ncbi:MAG: hypothetical protein ACJA0J_001139, partial [Bdellovibrionota bacterium]